MRHSTRALLAGASLALLTAWSYPTRLPAPTTIVDKPAYTFVDSRPEKWFKSGFESGNIGNCAYGILRVGQRDIDPQLPLFLHAMLAERFGDRMAGKKVELRGFSVHVNRAIETRRMAGQVVGSFGLLHKVIDDMTNDKEMVGCNAEDTFGGYVLGEVVSETPLIVAIDVFIDGKRLKGRAIAPSPFPVPPNKKAGPEIQAEWNAAVGALVQGAVKNLGDRMEAQLFVAAPAEPAVSTPAAALPPAPVEPEVILAPPPAAPVSGATD